MCGRYTLSSPGDLVAEAFGLSPPPELAPRFNIAPTQPVPIVRVRRPGAPRELALVRWGLIPPRAGDPEIGQRLINARAETVAEKPAFRSSLRRQRCLMPADGFFEWQAAGRRRQPWLFRRADGRPFAFAALWARWADPAAGDLESCALITTVANATVAPVHARMPVVLDPADFDLWLDPAVAGAAPLLPLLRSCPDDLLVARPVASFVNDPRHDRPDCLDPLSP